MRSLSIVPVLVIVLAGCGGGATVSQSQCYAGDWETLGYRDGSNGIPASRLLDHQDACVPHGVVPDRESYLAGWRDGVVEYCRPSNGFAVGEQGYVYDNVCPEQLRIDFERAYRAGRQIHLTRVAVDDLEQMIGEKNVRLAQIKQELVTSATDQLNPVLSPAQRVELLSWTQRLVEEKAAIERELPSLHAALAEKSAQLASLQTSMASA